MRSSRTRSLLVTASLLALCGLGWIYLAPVQIGGSTRYMITHGVSMEPMLHTGDLVLVRPAGSYQVGQVVAYRSTLLHTIVLHRIIRRQGRRYVFKGDNNNFIDPTHPTRSELIGRMWLHIPQGGVVLQWVHRPWVAALLLGLMAMFLLLGDGERRRRRDRRHRGRAGRTRRPPPMSSPSPRAAFPVSNQQLLSTAIVGMLVFAVLSVIAFVRPTSRGMTASQPYSETVRFGYHANVQPGPVYPNGIVATGDPIYIQLVHRIDLTATYRLTTAAPHRLHGTMRIRGTLSNTTGWRRSFWLGPPSRFVGNHGRAGAVISLTRLESLTSRISAQIGNGGSYALAVVPHVTVAGQIGGQPLAGKYSPSLSLSLGTPQFLAGASAITPPPGSSTGSSGLVQTASKSVTTARKTAVTLAGIAVATVRWIAILGFALFALLALYAGSREQQGDPDTAERINSRYRHLIVPVERLTPNPSQPPIEVSSIDALAQLAERSERLILHDHREDVDNYLIDDQGTLFQFTAPRVRTAHLNGNGTPPAHARQEEAIRSPERVDSPTDWLGVTETGGDPAHAEPVTNATAAILSSAAAKLSAAAAEATGFSAPVADPEGIPPRPVEEPPDGAPQPEPAPEPTRPRRDAAPPRPDGPVAARAGVRKRPSSLSRPAPAPVVSSVRGRSISRTQTAGAEYTRPPRSIVVHWSLRPHYRIGLTVGPLALTFLAWHRIRARRRRQRDEDAEGASRARGSWPTTNHARR